MAIRPGLKSMKLLQDTFTINGELKLALEGMCPGTSFALEA